MSLIYSITLHTLTFDNNGWQMIDIYYCLICYQGWLLGSKVYLPVFSENIEQELLIFLQGQCLKADNYSFILDKRSSYYLCLNSFLNWFYSGVDSVLWGNFCYQSREFGINFIDWFTSKREVHGRIGNY